MLTDDTGVTEKSQCTLVLRTLSILDVAVVETIGVGCTGARITVMSAEIKTKYATKEHKERERGKGSDDMCMPIHVLGMIYSLKIV